MPLATPETRHRLAETPFTSSNGSRRERQVSNHMDLRNGARRLAGRPGVVVQYPIVPMSYRLLGMSEQVSAIMRDMSHVAYQTVVASPNDVTFSHTHNYYQHVAAALQALENLRMLSHNLVQYAETMPTYFKPQGAV